MAALALVPADLRPGDRVVTPDEAESWPVVVEVGDTRDDDDHGRLVSVTLTTEEYPVEWPEETAVQVDRPE